MFKCRFSGRSILTPPSSLLAPRVSLLTPRDTEPSLHQVLRLVASLLCCQGQGVALGQGIAQVELRDDVVADSSAAEVLFADSDAVRVVPQHVLEILHRPLVDDKHRLAVALLLTLLVSQLLLLNLDIVFLRQPAQRLGIGDLLVLHQEVDGRSALSTGKALAYLLRRRHHERGRLVVVERAQTLIVHARLAQRHELAHHVYDVRSVHDLVYRQPVYHKS